VLLAHRLDIMSAQITSRARPNAPGGEAIDLFYVRDRGAAAGTLAAAKWDALRADLAEVFTGKTSVDALLRERTAKHKSALPPRVTPAVMTEIEVDNKVSADYTVIDVYTQDRPGVLYAIASTLVELSLDVYFSKVGTEADRVADVFYVRDKEAGGKITEPARLDEIERALAGALERLEATG
jgi:[protein-PII] uridylyltransferase